MDSGMARQCVSDSRTRWVRGPELLTVALDIQVESVGYQLKMPVGRPAGGVLESFLAEARRASGAQAG